MKEKDLKLKNKTIIKYSNNFNSCVSAAETHIVIFSCIKAQIWLLKKKKWNLSENLLFLTNDHFSSTNMSLKIQNKLSQTINKLQVYGLHVYLKNS